MHLKTLVPGPVVITRMNVNVVRHGLHEITGKEIVLCHVIGAVIPLRLWLIPCNATASAKGTACRTCGY